MSRSIVTLTMNPAVDVFLEVDEMQAYRKLRCGNPRHGPGGGGINVSRAIRRLGGESLAMFLAGGPSGELLKTLVRRESIRSDAIECEQPTRENVNIRESSTGKEFRFIVPGPKIGIDEWKHVLRAIASIRPRPDYVIASGSLPPGVPVDFYRRLATLARERGFRLMVDTSGEPLRHIGAGTFLLKLNLHELAFASGQNAPISDPYVEQACRAIVAAGRADVIVVSTGASGATVVDGEGIRRFSAPDVVIDSRIGAGDSMVAGLAVALSRGWTIDEAVQYGIAAGSAAVTTAGHQLCSRDVADRLYEQRVPTPELAAV